jgi:uncharacterized membrane protein
MKTFLCVALVANSLDLVATTFGIHWFGNQEGNPLLAPIARGHWWAFVLLKGVVVPLLIVWLFRLRSASPRLAPLGLALVGVVLTAAVGQWAGWMAAVMATTPFHP